MIRFTQKAGAGVAPSSAAISIAALLIISAGFSACSRGTQAPSKSAKPVVQSFATQLESSNMPGAGTPQSDSISVTLTLDKSQILGREFIYNLDLQYSSQYDEAMDLYNQSLVLTNVPVRFRIAGNQLQIVADQKLNFPSDVNHPERLIARFEILSQTDSQIVVKEMNSATFLAKQMGPVTEGSKEISYMDHWIRSFEFDPKGNYLLQQTSLLMNDGKTIGEFMESVYPRANIAKGASFEMFEMDPEDAVGSDEGAVARFRLLNGDTVYRGEKKVAYAQHFDISSGATIDWYVTPNIPEKYIEPVRQSIEGWNRYFSKMKGIERNVMRFQGKLPAGIRLGDPRFNVINWDSRLVAGAAYESQASDPETGRQSHSMIYLPAAWFQIGTDYWKKGVTSDPTVSSAPQPAAPMQMSSRLSCNRDLRDAAKLMASGRLDEGDIEKFGVELLKQTLFHEVGHALGLAHNFKGSLSFDRSKEGSLFSSSIMDYNDYEIERGAFTDVNSANGPLLEYDRQALSALYNGAKDVAEADAVLPACNDAEADNETGGVDPLCVRYDVEKDPTLSVSTAIRRIEAEKLDRDITLNQAIARIPSLILTDKKLAAAMSQDDVLLLADQFAATLKGTMNFYMISSKASLAYTIRANLKTLLEFGSALPEGYDARLMRERVFSGIVKAIDMRTLPEATQAALLTNLQEGMNRLLTTPYFKGLSAEDRTKQSSVLIKAMITVTSSFTTDAANGLVAMRAKVLTALARKTKVDFFLGKAGDSVVDYEKGVINVLAEVVITKDRTGTERAAAAKSLATYKGRLQGNDAISSVKSSLLQERVLASTNAQRRAIEAILAALGLNNT